MNLSWKQHHIMHIATVYVVHHASCELVGCTSLSMSLSSHTASPHIGTSCTPVDRSLSLACVISFCLRFAFGAGLSPCACWFSQTVTLSPGAFGFMPSQVAHIAMVLSVEWWLVPLFLFSIQSIGGWRPTNRSAHTSRMLHGYEDPDTRILADLQALVIGLLARIRKEPLSPER